MRFPMLTPDERERAESLLNQYRMRPKNANALFMSLCGAAARQARHGNPPTRAQRLGYRTAKRNRARKAAMLLYGDPAAECPQPGVLPEKPAKKRKAKKTQAQSEVKLTHYADYAVLSPAFRKPKRKPKDKRTP